MPLINDVLWRMSFSGDNYGEVAREMLGYIDNPGILGARPADTLLRSMRRMQFQGAISEKCDKAGRIQISKGTQAPPPRWLN